MTNSYLFCRKVFAVYSEGEADLADEMNAAKDVVVKQRQTREEREAKKRSQVTPSSSNTTDAAGDAPKKKQVRDSACSRKRLGCKDKFLCL